MHETLRAEAFALQRAGRFVEAERLYAEVLRQNPHDFDALHLQGVLALEPQLPVALIAGAAALRRLGRPEAALRARMPRTLCSQPPKSIFSWEVACRIWDGLTKRSHTSKRLSHLSRSTSRAHTSCGIALSR